MFAALKLTHDGVKRLVNGRKTMYLINQLRYLNSRQYCRYTETSFTHNNNVKNDLPSAVLPTIHFASISFSFSYFENIPSLSGADFMFNDIGRHHVGTTATESRVSTGFYQLANRPLGLDERSAGWFGTVLCRRPGREDPRFQKRFGRRRRKGIFEH